MWKGRELNEKMFAYTDNCWWSYMGVLHTILFLYVKMFIIKNLKQNKNHIEVPSWLSGLIWHCHCCSSHYSCCMGLISGSGTSACCSCGQKNETKQNKQKTPLSLAIHDLQTSVYLDPLKFLSAMFYSFQCTNIVCPCYIYS